MTLRHPRAAVAALALTAGCALALSSCASPTDPAVTRESLQEVATAPAPKPDPDPAEEEAEEVPVEVELLECSPYLVVTARGTGEPTTGQLLSPVARTIAQSRPDQVVTVDVEYPADTDVNGGATLGVRSLVTMLNQQTLECAEQKFVLLGYSQGAMVVGDALSAPADRLVGEQADELSAEAAAAVIAVVFYGDPRFVGAAPYNAGSYDEERDGLLPRPVDSLADYADEMRNYCVSADFICQAVTSGLDESGHVEYFDNGMQQDGAAFAISKLAPLPKGSKKGRDSKGSEDAKASADANGSTR
ncbi:hypothetical protein JOF28_000632 [Leucobacter exalbidus]|uniref:Cutinase n=1 Tax=Leucobacter exalbidus TaxID=662960 RepID=A0A940PSG3_9MICO|nr:hypothetical protein [Leucobacter exalbidus]